MIRSLHLLLAILAAFAAMALVQDISAQKNKCGDIEKNSRATTLEGKKAELLQIEKDIGKANVERNKAFFECIEADEFIFTDPGGGVTTKSEDVASLDKPPGTFRLISYDVSDVNVMIYGKTAVVTGISATLARSTEREVSSKSRFTDVFVKRDGRWQLVAGHSSRIREPQKP